MLKNGQTYFKYLAVFTPQDFSSMFGHFSTLYNKGLIEVTGEQRREEYGDKEASICVFL